MGRPVLVKVGKQGQCVNCGSSNIVRVSASSSEAAAVITQQKKNNIRALALDLHKSEPSAFWGLVSQMEQSISDIKRHMAETAELLQGAAS
jgi:predicted SPOUT superfamily RNA methylase MTH1